MQYVSSHAISSIQLTQLVVLDGASKDAQNPSFTLLLLLLLLFLGNVTLIFAEWWKIKYLHSQLCAVLNTLF